VADPRLAARPDVAVITACEYWDSRGLNRFADRDDLRRDYT
jgi:predicted chitinase